jgi:hypothetical protein
MGRGYGGVGGMLPLIPYFNLIKEKYYIIFLNQKNKLILLKKHKKKSGISTTP